MIDPRYSVSLPDFTPASIRGRALSLTQSRAAFSVLMMNSYSPLSGASTEPCQLTRNSCENGLKDDKGTKSIGACCHLLDSSFIAFCSGIGLSVPKLNWISGSTRFKPLPASPLLRLRRPPAGIIALQAPLIVPFAGPSEAADQVGDRVSILAHGETGELDPGRLKLVASLRGFRVERLIDVGRDPIGILAHALAGGILGHRLGDQRASSATGRSPTKRPRVMIVGAFPGRP